MMVKIKNIGTPAADVEGKVQKSIKSCNSKIGTFTFIYLFIFRENNE